MKESLAETWYAEGTSFREQEQAYAAATMAELQRRRVEQEREKQALESENFHSYSRNADLGDTGLKFAARRTYSPEEPKYSVGVSAFRWSSTATTRLTPSVGRRGTKQVTGERLSMQQYCTCIYNDCSCLVAHTVNIELSICIAF